MADSLSSIPGVSTGIDWKSLVDSIITADKQPAVRMQATIDAGTKRKTALATLGTQLQALQAASDTLRAGASGAAFASFSVSAPGTDAAGRAVLAATADTTATPGNYDVTVSALAAAEKRAGAVGFASGATLPTAGAITLTRPAASGASTTLGTITVTASSTLASVRDAVNALNTGTSPSGVSANIITVADGDQRLVLSATSTGVANGFALSDDGSGVLGSLGLDPAGSRPPTTQAAADAKLTVDGVAVTRPTNVVQGAVPGVTLTLGSLGNSAVAVARNGKSASDAAQAFVDGYNKIVATLQTQTAAGQPLASDTLARGLRSALAGTLLTPATAAANGTGGVASDLTTLSAIGITVQKDGTLALDAAKFQSVTGDRLSDATALLANRMGAMSSYLQGTAAPITGQLDTRGRSIDDANARLQQRIDDLNAREDKKRTALLAQYSKYEAAIGRLQALQSSMAGQFASLSGSSSSR